MLKFKKVASILAGAAMFGSTVAFAAAANYPSPFISGSNADVAVVWGMAGQNTDLAAALDITNDLNARLLQAGGGSSGGSTGGGTPTGGDFVKLERSSTKFQLGKGVLDVVSGTLNDDDLEVLLADGVFLDNDNDEFDYTQKIVMANLSLTMFDDSDYKADTPTVGIKVANAGQILNYTLDFTDVPTWADLSTSDINIMGVNYYILSTTTNTTLNLLDSASTTILNEGETKTLTVGDKTYDVALEFIASNSVKLNVNGQTTNSLATGQTYKLSDGVYIGIKEVNTQDYQGGIKQVEFSIGSGKLQITSGADVKINEDTINGLTGHLTNSGGSSGDSITRILLQWTADDDMFITDDSSITMPGLKNLKVSFGGMTFPMEEKFSIEAGSRDYLQLKDFPLKDSTETIDLLYGSSGAYTGIGKDSTNLLRTTNQTAITFDGDTDQYFVVSYNDGTNAESYLVKATSFITESSVNKTTIQYKKDGSWVTKKENAIHNDQVTFGNAVITVDYVQKTDKTVNFTSGTNVKFNTLYSKEGLKLNLPWATDNVTYLAGAINFTAATVAGHNGTSFHLEFNEEDKNENVAPTTVTGAFNATLGWNAASTRETHVSDVVGESVTFEEIGSTDVFRSFMYSPLASEMLWDQSGDQYSLQIIYHGKESYGSVYVTDVSTSVAVSGGDSGGAVNIVSVKDSEIDSVAGKNLVVIGGTCVNKISAELLGKTFPTCGADFTAATGVGANEFLIQTFSRTGGKVATLVAGYNAGDTTNAAKYLTTQTNVDTTVGKKYKGTSATSATLVTA
ncbi:MAG: hypothetical protein AABY05_02385 [Nanoarchaeota archaeon]